MPFGFGGPARRAMSVCLGRSSARGVEMRSVDCANNVDGEQSVPIIGTITVGESVGHWRISVHISFLGKRVVCQTHNYLVVLGEGGLCDTAFGTSRYGEIDSVYSLQSSCKTSPQWCRHKS